VAGAIKKKMRSLHSGSDGVVGIDGVFRNAFLRKGSILDYYECFALSVSRFAPVRSVIWMLRDFFLMSRPPLLCQEGSATPQFIRTSYDRASFPESMKYGNTFHNLLV
jgi:hypothetical protein